MENLIGIVTSNYDGWEVNQICKSIKNNGFNYQKINSSNYSEIITSNSIQKYHAVLGRVERPFMKTGMLILNSLELNEENVFNKCNAIQQCHNKIHTSQLLVKNGVPTPKTYFFSSPQVAYAHLHNLNYPLVLKPYIGGRGHGIILADSAKGLYNCVEVLGDSDTPVYLQEYIKAKRDIRVIVVGDEVIGAIYRYPAPDQWKTNLTYGGQATKCELNDNIIETALKAKRAVNADIAGIDLIEDSQTNQYVVLEINICPLFQGFYNITNINPADHIAQLLIDGTKTKHQYEIVLEK